MPLWITPETQRKIDEIYEQSRTSNPLADSTLTDLGVVKVSVLREKLRASQGWSGSWIATLRTETAGYHVGRGSNPAEALDDALKALAERRPL